MIVGQILVNGIVYSCHRYAEPDLDAETVRHRLLALAHAEALPDLGKVELRVHAPRGIERLMNAILGAGA